MHGLELEWIQWIHQFRTPFLDSFFLFLRFFDRQEFAFVLIPIVWLNYGWKNGLRLFYVLFFSSLLNHSLKDFFASPRPCSLIPELALYSIEGYGFPSGAAQTAMLLSGLFVYFQKNPWKWALAVPYFFLLSFSRVYLGVHYPTDVLGGWVSGFALLLCVLFFLPKVENRLKNASIYKLISLHLFVVITLALSIHHLADSYIGCSIGLATGLWMCHKFTVHLPKSHGIKEFALRSLIGVSGVFLLYFLIPLPSLFKVTLCAIWISFASPLILKQKLFLQSKG